MSKQKKIKILFYTQTHINLYCLIRNFHTIAGLAYFPLRPEARSNLLNSPIQLY